MEARVASVDTRGNALIAMRMTTTSQRIIITVSSVLVGCAVGATLPRLAAQSYPPNPSAPRWEQHCEYIDESGDDEDDRVLINEKLRSRGDEGFELASTGFAQPYDGIFLCFKRPAAR